MKPVIDSVSDEITFRSEKNEYDVTMRKSAEKRQTFLLTLLVIIVVTLIVWTMNAMPPTATSSKAAAQSTHQSTQAALIAPSQHSSLRMG